MYILTYCNNDEMDIIFSKFNSKDDAVKELTKQYEHVALQNSEYSIKDCWYGVTNAYIDTTQGDRYAWKIIDVDRCVGIVK